MKPRAAMLEKIYDRDPVSKAFIVKISIDNYHDIFNDLDPAPWKRRDLDPDMRLYLEDSSQDIPLKYKLALQFIAPKDIKDAELEKRVMAGLTTYFQFIKRTFRREIAHTYRRSMVYIISSFVLLSIAFYLTSVIPENFLYITAVEGFYIGGWVFLWEAIALFVFKSRETSRQSRRYERLETAPIDFTYQ